VRDGVRSACFNRNRNFKPFTAELVPGLDLVPFWTLVVVNVYRKWKRVEYAVRVIDVEPIERNSRAAD
jgi:hypothetical protein